jgi:hypothetical protein
MEKQNQFINKIIDLIFSKNNIKYLIILFLIAFVLRSIAGINISPNADEMVHGTHALGIIESNKLQIMDQDAIWFYITDIFYRSFGEDLFALRFASILFGSLSILLVYLIGKELWNKRTALIASFILTFSSYHIIMSLAEMDTSMIFFVLIGIYFLIKSLKEQKNLYYTLSFLFLGISIMIKQIALLLTPIFFFFMIGYKIKNKESNLKLKHLIYFILILFIILIPILTFNYLLYKDKGLVDLQFSRFLGIGKGTYSSIEATLKPFSFNDLFFKYENHPAGLSEGFMILFNFAPLILILGLLGLIIAFIRKNKFTMLLFLSLLVPFIFLSGTSLLPTHFIFAIPLLSLFSANVLNVMIEKLEKTKVKPKIIIFTLLVIILIFSLVAIKNENIFKGKNEMTKLIDFKKENIEENSLVLADSRIYLGRIALSFNDRHYLKANLLNDLIKNQDQLPGQNKEINLYFIECVTDDCGWGTINNQPEFNQSMEEITNSFKSNFKSMITIDNIYGEPYFSVYKSKINLKETSLNLVDTTHSWFYYPLRYKGESFDDYQTKNFFDKVLDNFARYILYLEISITLLTVIFLIYWLFREENETKHNNSGVQ